MIYNNVKHIDINRIVASNPSYTKHKVRRCKIPLSEMVTKRYDEIQMLYFKPNLKDKIKTIVMLIFGGKLSYIIKQLI